MDLQLARQITFEASHRYYREEWSKEKNQQIFGACANDHGHGHNYRLEAFFKGPVDPQTGMVVNLKFVDELLKKVIQPIDQHNLNQLAAFRDKIPTTETLAQYIWESLVNSDLPPGIKLAKIRLHESDDLWVEVCDE